MNWKDFNLNKPTANEDEYRKQKRAKELKQKHMKMTKNHIVYVMEIYFCYIILFYILLYVYCLINYVNKKIIVLIYWKENFQISK